MKTHLFQATTMAAAVAKVKASLGPDALIMGTRTLRQARLFSRSRGQLVEITAAEADTSQPVQHPGPKRFTSANRISPPAAGAADWIKRDQPPAPASLSSDRIRLNSRLTPAPAISPGHLPGRLGDLFESFVSNQVHNSLARQLLADLPADLELDYSTESNPLLRRIEKLLPTAGPIRPGLPGKPQVVSFIGPTGVGKTTTIAKLAAQYKLQRNTSIALLTIDTYRIAAVDQLRTYADIIDAPFAVVLKPTELREQIEKLKHCSLIFVDTTGRSPNDNLRLAELRSFHEAMGPHQTHLVLAATAAHTQITQAIEKFTPLGINQLLLTKLDETLSISPLLNVFSNTTVSAPQAPLVPISYVTAGQDVPDDIEIASSRTLAQRILGEHCAQL